MKTLATLIMMMVFFIFVKVGIQGTISSTGLTSLFSFLVCLFVCLFVCVFCLFVCCFVCVCLLVCLLACLLFCYFVCYFACLFVCLLVLQCSLNPSFLSSSFIQVLQHDSVLSETLPSICNITTTAACPAGCDCTYEGGGGDCSQGATCIFSCGAAST